MQDTIGKKLYRYRRVLGLSQKDVAEQLKVHGCNVTNQAVSKWEQGLTQPNAEQFLALCRILKIEDISYTFLGQSGPMTRGLNEQGIQKVKEFADILRASGLYSGHSKLPKMRVLPLYSMPVSAGTGQFLDESDYTPVEVGADVPETADFGVRISGDSMEPKFFDGQTVWVRSQNIVTNGEIGVFLYDNNVYLKQLLIKDGVFLHSFNPKYTDIAVKAFGELRVLGKALA